MQMQVGGALAVMVGLVAVIALLAIGAAALGASLTAGAIGFVAFGAAALMVGAGFALIGAAAEAINAEYRRVQDINSPSRVWRSYGRYTIEGSILGMEESLPKLQATANKAATVAYPYDRYTPEGDAASYSSSNVTESNVYSPQFNLSVSGSNSD